MSQWSCGQDVRPPPPFPTTRGAGTIPHASCIVLSTQTTTKKIPIAPGGHHKNSLLSDLARLCRRRGNQHTQNGRIDTSPPSCERSNHPHSGGGRENQRWLPTAADRGRELNMAASSRRRQLRRTRKARERDRTGVGARAAGRIEAGVIKGKFRGKKEIPRWLPMVRNAKTGYFGVMSSKMATVVSRDAVLLAHVELFHFCITRDMPKFALLFDIRLNFTVLYALEPASFLHRLPHEHESTPFLTELHAIEVRMEKRRNERAKETGDSRESPPASDIVMHDSHMRKSGSDPVGDWIRFTLVGMEQANR
ncbi:hypothetical protein PR048_003496 [Dryococelus australis]|uniref:Uncharacterized protein n=1 Tax=Dryococelus australis TaxID=614101 RepID=A0ABQ9IN93_9NEOP|nr:hypothetical protein PR048_003496 [Dryococelus australis]